MCLSHRSGPYQADPHPGPRPSLGQYTPTVSPYLGRNTHTHQHTDTHTRHHTQTLQHTHQQPQTQSTQPCHTYTALQEGSRHIVYGIRLIMYLWGDSTLPCNTDLSAKGRHTPCCGTSHSLVGGGTIIVD